MRRPSLERLALTPIYAAYAAVGLFGFYLTWFRLNVLQVDLSGHIASAAALLEGGFHQYNDGFFLGFVNNLAYPPLEDLLIAGLGFAAGDDMLLGYRIYLSLLVPFFLFVTVWLSAALVSARARAVFLIGMLALLFLDKSGSSLQGLGLIDIFVTGLTAQVLAACWFLLALRELLNNRPTWRLSLFLSLAVISHLVVGPFALLTALMFAVVRGSRAVAFAVGLAILTGATTIGPLIAYRSEYHPSTIAMTPPDFIFTALLLLVVLLRRDRTTLPVPLTGLVVLLPGYIQSRMMTTFDVELLPDFHYYRLSILALIMLVLSMALLSMQSNWRGLRRDMALAVIVIVAFLGTQQLSLGYFDLHSDALTEAEVPEDLGEWIDGPDRVFVVSRKRPSDFHYGTAMRFRGSVSPFVKGLYWETSASNSILSSYLAMLLDPSDVLLDYVHYSPLSCDTLRGLWDNFIDDYSIGRLLVEDDFEASYLSDSKRRCYRELLRSGTTHHRFEVTKERELNGHRLQLYKIVEHAGGNPGGWARTIDPSRIVVLEDAAESVELQVMKRVLAAADRDRIDRSVFVSAAQLQRLTPYLSSLSGVERPVELLRHAAGSYELDLGPATELVAINLNRLPGMELISDQGERLPTIAALGSTLGVARGRVGYRYRRPATLWICYGLSFLGICLNLLVGLGSLDLHALVVSIRRPAADDRERGVGSFKRRNA